MADDSVRRDGDTDEDADAANDAPAEESDDTADPTAEESVAPDTPEEPPTDESPADAMTFDGSQAPTDSEAGQGDEGEAMPSERASADDAGRGEGRIARLASRWPLRGRFWRFIAGVSALSVTALLVLSVVAVAIEVFDDDDHFDEGWFAYSTGPGPDGIDFIGEAYHNGYRESYAGYGESYDGYGDPYDGYGGRSDSLGSDGYRGGNRSEKPDIGGMADCDSDRRACRGVREHDADHMSRCDSGAGRSHRGIGDADVKNGAGAWGRCSDGSPHSSRNYRGYGRGPLRFDRSAAPSGFGRPFADRDDFAFRGEISPFGLFGAGSAPFGGPRSDLPGPLGLIGGLGEAEVSELIESCEQFLTRLGAWDGGISDETLPPLGVGELLLAVVCPAVASSDSQGFGTLDDSEGSVADEGDDERGSDSDDQDDDDSATVDSDDG